MSVVITIEGQVAKVYDFKDDDTGERVNVASLEFMGGKHNMKLNSNMDRSLFVQGKKIRVTFKGVTSGKTYKAGEVISIIDMDVSQNPKTK